MTGRYGVARAVRELTSIFSCQWANGMLPQIRFMPGMTGYRPDATDWGVTSEISGPTALPTSGITQPPIMGLCARDAFLKLTREEQEQYLSDFLYICEGLERFHGWLLSERDPHGENLALCLHPWETGTDNSPAFDSLVEATRLYIEKQGIQVDTFGRADTAHVPGEHRPTDRDYFAYFGLLQLFKLCRYSQPDIISKTPFLLQDILFNTLLAASLFALASLQSDLSRHFGAGLETRSEGNRRRGEAVAAAIRGKLYDETSGLFYSYDLTGGSLLRTPTVSSLLPLMDGIALEGQTTRLLEHLKNSGEFWTEVPVPSTAISSPAFNPLRYWSGPSWPVTNWLVLRGVEAHDPELARRLREITVAMIQEDAGEEEVRAAARGLLEMNSHGEEFTTPSRKQYAHAWLWDSAIVALSWPLVEQKPAAYTPGIDNPGFWEYYHPHTGAHLGAPLMSWTASLYLELDAQQNKNP